MPNEIDIRPLDPLRPGSVSTVVVKIRDSLLQLAVQTLLNRHGFQVTEIDNGKSIVVTDDDRYTGTTVTRLIEDLSGPSQSALLALQERKLGAVVYRNDPHHLAVAVSAVSQGMVAAPGSIFDSAYSIPQLTQREATVLHYVGLGMSNARISTHVGITEHLVKKTVSNLLRMFDAKSRVELAVKANEIGYKPKK